MISNDFYHPVDVNKNGWWDFIKSHGTLGVISLWPSDTIWWYRCGSSLAQVMACRLIATSHYLNQFWLIIKCVLWYSPESTFVRSAHGTPGFIYPEIFTCPTLIVVIFFFSICLYRECKRKLYSNPLAWLVISLALGHWAMGYVEPWKLIHHMSSETTLLKLVPHLSGINELMMSFVSAGRAGPSWFTCVGIAWKCSPIQAAQIPCCRCIWALLS